MTPILAPPQAEARPCAEGPHLRQFSGWTSGKLPWGRVSKAALLPSRAASSPGRQVQRGVHSLLPLRPWAWLGCLGVHGAPGILPGPKAGAGLRFRLVPGDAGLPQQASRQAQAWPAPGTLPCGSPSRPQTAQGALWVLGQGARPAGAAGTCRVCASPLPAARGGAATRWGPLCPQGAACPGPARPPGSWALGPVDRKRKPNPPLPLSPRPRLPGRCQSSLPLAPL